MSTDERRALALIAALLILTGAARYLERPRPVLPDVPSLDLAALEAASRGAGDAQAPAAPIDPNTASVAELDRLPGVGAALARRIVEERARAPFRSLEDLRRVKGVGAALLEKMAPHVTLKPGASPRTFTATSSPAARSPAADGPVDLNSADATALQRLRGVGPALAARLMARRDSLGRFGSWEDVDAVPGIGPAMLARLRETAVLGQ